MTTVGIRVLVHLQGKGDVHYPAGEYAGTRHESRRLEGFMLLPSSFPPGVTAEYMAHLQGKGDTSWVQAGEYCGTRDESRRLEGIAVRLVGPSADKWSVQYYTHVQNHGDIGPVSKRNGQPIPVEMRPAMDGEYSGTRARSLRVEGLRVWLEAVENSSGPLPLPGRPTRDPGYIVEPAGRYQGGYLGAHTFIDPHDPDWLLIYSEGIPESGLGDREPVVTRWNPVTGETRGPTVADSVPQYRDPRPRDGRPWKALRYVRDKDRQRQDHQLYVRRSADGDVWQEKVALRGPDIHDTTWVMGHYPANTARAWPDEYVLAVRPRFPQGHTPARTIAIARSPWWWDHGAWMGRWNGTEDLFMTPDFSIEPKGVEYHNIVPWRRHEGGPREDTLLLVVVLHWSRAGATGARANTTEVRLAVTRDRFRSWEWLYREPYLERQADRPMIWPYAPVWYQPTSEVLFPFVESTARHTDAQIKRIGTEHHQSIGVARLRVRT